MSSNAEFLLTSIASYRVTKLMLYGNRLISEQLPYEINMTTEISTNKPADVAQQQRRVGIILTYYQLNNPVT